MDSVFYDIIRTSNGKSEKIGQVNGGEDYVSWSMFWSFVDTYEIAISLSILTLSFNKIGQKVSITADKSRNLITLITDNHVVQYEAVKDEAI